MFRLKFSVKVGAVEKKYIFGVVAAVILLASGVLYYFLGMQGNSNITAFDDKGVSPVLMAQLHNIANNETLANEIGIGTSASEPFPVNGPVLVGAGKPEIMYVGADFCPYCSITRWGIVVALMRFGNFTQLRYMTSSASDIYPNSATFTFYNSNYSSVLLNFTGVEVMTKDNKPLQTLNMAENTTFDKYNLNNAELPSELRGSIPFIDFANNSVMVGSLVIAAGHNQNELGRDHCSPEQRQLTCSSSHNWQC